MKSSYCKGFVLDLLMFELVIVIYYRRIFNAILFLNIIRLDSKLAFFIRLSFQQIRRQKIPFLLKKDQRSDGYWGIN